MKYQQLDLIEEFAILFFLISSFSATIITSVLVLTSVNNIASFFLSLIHQVN